jgi:hypothetical protein
MPIFIETEEDNTTPTPRNFLDSPINPGDRFVGQTHGPAGMGMRAYMDRPETQPDWTPYDRSMGYTSPAHPLGQTQGPAGMGMNAYVNRPGPTILDNQISGITNPNLNGYKVMNASDPTGNDGWIDRLGRWLFNDPYDKESDESLYQGTEQDKLESEYGTEGTGEFYPDKILRDLYPQALGEQSPYTSDQELNNFFEGLDSEDLGVEPQLEASVDPADWRTIIKILEAGGNPDDYINVRHDMGDDVEEEGGGWLSNPLMKELRRRNMERGREQMMEDSYRRLMEESQRLQMDMLMNRNKFNTVPGTGDINPIFGDPYWNI